jgi:GNAT superfamily N-acetyltransferase
VAARAFLGDPGFGYILPCPRRRARLLPAFLAGRVRYTLARGLALTVGDGAGIALLLPPGHDHVTTGGALRAGLLFPTLRLGLPSFVRLCRAAGAMDRCHARLVRVPHWYLLLLAVDPSCQGRGLGAALLRDIASRVDAGGQPCYLETTRPGNVALYEKHGYSVLREDRLPGGLPFWAMLRRPAGREPTA